MDEAARSNARSLLLTYLRDELRVEETLEDDTLLVSSGLLDSTDVLRLATRLEREFGIEIPDADIELEHFNSLASILDYLDLALVGALSEAPPTS